MIPSGKRVTSLRDLFGPEAFAVGSRTVGDGNSRFLHGIGPEGGIGQPQWVK